MTLLLRCATYARYSTDRQKPVSIEDQLRKCQEFAGRQGWLILPDHYYSDHAMSGTTDNRSGLRRLIEVATAPSRPFDAVLIDDTSRLSRKLIDSLRISERLRFAGVRLVFVSQGIDTDSEQAEVLLATHGIVDSLYIRELAKKVYRGVEGRALKGLHPGGRCFGYRSVPIEDPTRTDAYGRPKIIGVKLAIDESEAASVRKVFSLYASGYSFERIGKRMNIEKDLSPRPRNGDRSQSWGASTVQKILHNDRYRGMVIWNKTRKLRSPETGRRIYRHRPPNEWVMVEAPEQRIVSDELWDQVHQRIAQVKELYQNEGQRAGLLRARAVNSPYLFSGFLKCGVCGSNMAIVTGRGTKNPYARYGCPRNALQAVCANSLRIRRDKLENALLSKLQTSILHPRVIDYTLARFEEQLKAALKSQDNQLDDTRRRKVKLQEEVRRLTMAIADGLYSPTISAEIAGREREIADLSRRLVDSTPEAITSQVRSAKEFVMLRLGDLARLLNRDVISARAELAKHLGSVTLNPEDGIYRAVGTWDLLGSVRMVAASEREVRTDDPTPRSKTDREHGMHYGGSRSQARAPDFFLPPRFDAEKLFLA